MPKTPLIIYHGGCNDGFTAALIADIFFKGECELYPAYDRKGPPLDLDLGRVVFILDYSYSEEVLREMAQVAKIVIVIDHHKTAEADLANIPRLTARAPINAVIRGKRPSEEAQRAGKLYAVFDMERSGAQMAWDFFYPDTVAPKLVQYVQDRDMWWFHLPDSEAINAALTSYDQELTVWRQLMERLNDPWEYETLKIEGLAILRIHKRNLRAMADTVVRYMILGDRSVPVANVPGQYASDMAGMLALESPHGYAATYYDTREGRRFSLRSRGHDAPDVSLIAKRHGGGGHRNAAGFLAPHNWEGEYDA